MFFGNVNVVNKLLMHLPRNKGYSYFPVLKIGDFVDTHRFVSDKLSVPLPEEVAYGSISDF